MLLSIKKAIPLILLFLGLSLYAACDGHGEVVVFDDATTVQTPIRIKVLTKGKFFARGGRMVDLYLDEAYLKRIMTGGDGYGYFKYTPEKSGMKSIKARSNSQSASGFHLVMAREEKAVVIDIEGAFKNAVFSEEIRDDSQAAVKSLSKEFEIIYMSRFVGKGISRSWLDNEDFPLSVILRWKGSNSFKILTQRAIKLHAVIGSAAVISAAKKYVDNRFTFEKTRDGTMVKDWDEILKLLQSAGPGNAAESGLK